MMWTKEWYNSACAELRIMSQKDRVLGLNEAERIRFDALSEQVGRYEEDPAIFHRQRYSSGGPEETSLI